MTGSSSNCWPFGPDRGRARWPSVLRHWPLLQHMTRAHAWPWRSVLPPADSSFCTAAPRGTGTQLELRPISPGSFRKGNSPRTMAPQHERGRKEEENEGSELHLKSQQELISG